MGAITVILCKWAGKWFVTSGMTRDGACALHCAKRMPHPDDFQIVPGGSGGTRVYGKIYEVEDITFYPELRFAGFPVTPINWDTDSSEPRLHCRMEISVHRGMNRDERLALVSELETLGWHWDMKEGGRASVHLDDLEKIEGPPPPRTE